MTQRYCKEEVNTLFLTAELLLRPGVFYLPLIDFVRDIVSAFRSLFFFLFNAGWSRKSQTPTKEVHHKAVVVAVDVGGRVGLELNGDVRHGGVELEVRPRTAVLPQDVRRQVVAIVEGQQVVLADVETRIHKRWWGKKKTM